MTVFLGLLAFAFLVLTVIAGFWWGLADSNDDYNYPPKNDRRSVFLYCLVGFGFFFWLIY